MPSCRKEFHKVNPFPYYLMNCLTITAHPHQFYADPDPTFTLMRIRIHILLLIKVMRTWCDHWSIDPTWFHSEPARLLKFVADPDPAFDLDADPDPAFHYDADPCGPGSAIPDLIIAFYFEHDSNNC